MRGKLACAAVLMILAAQTWADEDKLEIKPFIKPGNYVVTVTLAATVPSAGPTTQLSFRDEAVIELTVSKPEASSQKWLLTHKLDHSTGPYGPEGRMTIRKRSVEGKWMELVINDKGEITELEFHIGSGPATRPSMEEVKTKATRDIGMILPHILLLTAHSVGPGKAWDGVTIGGYIRTKCKLIKLDKDTALLEGELSGNRSGLVVAGKQVIRYDRLLQLAVSSHLEQKAKYETSGDISKESSGTSESVLDVTVKPGKYDATSKPSSAPAGKPAEK